MKCKSWQIPEFLYSTTIVAEAEAALVRDGQLRLRNFWVPVTLIHLLPIKKLKLPKLLQK